MYGPTQDGAARFRQPVSALQAQLFVEAGNRPRHPSRRTYSYPFPFHGVTFRYPYFSYCQPRIYICHAFANIHARLNMICTRCNRQSIDSLAKSSGRVTPEPTMSSYSYSPCHARNHLPPSASDHNLRIGVAVCSQTRTSRACTWLFVSTRATRTLSRPITM